MLGDTDKEQSRSAWWLQQLHAIIKSAGGTAFYGQVTTATSTTKFKVDAMSGLGTDLLNDVYYCQVVQADAAAPEGEVQKVSAYDTSDGDITVGAAFTVAPEVGDYVIILHESVVTAVQNSTENLLTKDVIGNKTDTAAIPSDTTSLVAGLKKIYSEVVSITIAGELFYVSGPANLEIDDIGNYNIGLYDVGDGIPTSAEITAGNYQIDRVRDGALTNIVASTGASKADGRIYCNETFDAASGWATGDLVLVTFSGGSVTPTGGATTVLPNAYLYSRVVRGETIEGYTEKIYDVSFGVAPADGSLASFIATGGTALGTRLPVSKSLYDVIALDRLDNGTYGLSALDTELGLVPQSGGAATWNAAALQSIQDEAEDALEGENLDHLVKTAVDTNLQTTVADDSVEGYLLSKANVSNFDRTVHSLEALGDVIAALATISSGAETTGSYNLPNDTAENTAIEITTTKRQRLESVWLDFATLVQDVTIKVYHKIDGTNYRQYDEFTWSTSEEDGVLITGLTINNDWKLSVTSGTAQGAIMAIPYNVIYTPMEA